MTRFRLSALAMILLSLSVLTMFSGCGPGKQETTEKLNKLRNTENAYKLMTERIAATQANLSILDSLTSYVFIDQDYDKMQTLYDQNVKINYPDGSTTIGVKNFCDALKNYQVFTPDCKISSRPVRFGDGEWTCEINNVEMTFAKAMRTKEGKSYTPDGKTYMIELITVSRWRGDKIELQYFLYGGKPYIKQVVEEKNKKPKM